MIIKRLDYLIFLLHIPKANWTCDLITDYRKSLKLVTFIFTDSRKSLELVTFIVVYHHSTDCVHIHLYSKILLNVKILDANNVSLDKKHCQNILSLPLYNDMPVDINIVCWSCEPKL